MNTYWHICSPDRHQADCQDHLTITTERPRTKPGVLVIEFHPPRELVEQNESQVVSTEEALRWPHVISYA